MAWRDLRVQADRRSRAVSTHHSHAMVGTDHRGRLVAVLGITVAVLVIEIVGAVVSGSLALLADAGHMLTDVAGLTLALVAAAVIALTGWVRADAIACLVIGALIVPRTLALLRESVDVLLESTPRGLDLKVVRERILSLPPRPGRPRPPCQPSRHRAARPHRARSR